MELLSILFYDTNLILALVFLFPLRHRSLSRVISLIFTTIFLWNLSDTLNVQGLLSDSITSLMDNLIGCIFMMSLYYYASSLIKPEKEVSLKTMARLFLVPVACVGVSFYTPKPPLMMNLSLLIFFSGLFSTLFYKGICTWKESRKIKYLAILCFVSLFIGLGWIDLFFDLNLNLIFSLVMMAFSLGVFYGPQAEKKNKSKKFKITGQASEIDNLLKERVEEEFFADADITLTSVSEELGVSSHQLSSFLNNYYGQNFNDYINTFRIEKAKKLLLKERERTVLEIGFQVGFNTSSTFYKAFQRKVGMAPGKYRKQGGTAPIE